MQREVRYCTTEDGVRIAYIDVGTGFPLVRLTGLWSNVGAYGENWARAEVDGVVQAGARYIAYDGRGIGSSDREVKDFSLTARLRDLTAVIDHLGLRRHILWGVGRFVQTALAYAALQPDRVSHLILDKPFARGVDLHRQLPLTRALMGSASGSKAEWHAVAETMAAANADRPENWLDTIAPGTYRRYVRATHSIDVSAMLGDIRARTLVIHQKGAGDEEITRQVVAAIPGARLVWVDLNDAFRQTGLAMTEFLAPPGANDLAATPARLRAPDVFRTVLFTDLVGHTEMMQRLGDAHGRAVLREHERLTREVLKQHSGVELKTMGDGFMASFASATQAIECAIALQRAVAQHNADSVEPLRVRVGVNAGEPIAESGDLFGSTVILASRVAAEAEADEILIPEPVRHLLAGKGFTFVDHGEFLPRGFDEVVRLFEVRWQPSFNPATLGS
jgi:class 3 adenylate cyclase